MSNYDKLKKTIEEIDELMSDADMVMSPAFKAWKAQAEHLLAQLYGRSSVEYSNFTKLYFSPPFNVGSMNPSKYYKNGLETAKRMFLNYLDDLNENQPESCDTKSSIFSKVFIIHGHDGELKHAVARQIEKQGLEAIILSEKMNPGKTIIEKIEQNSNVAGAICLFTADDLGRATDEPSEKPRARQNVVFEAGYFMGKLGRSHVIIICEKDVEIPGDLSGVVYTEKNSWELEMLKSLKTMGYSIDLNKLLG